jgi:tetratricopeptide (TPR) repeat protein
MRAQARVTRLPKISRFLDSSMIISVVLVFASGGAQGQAPPVPLPYRLPVSGTLPLDECRSVPSVAQIENKIPQLVNSSRWLELETVGSQLVRLCPNSDLGYHWVGVSYLRQGRSFAAIRAFEDSLRRHDDAGAHLLLAEGYYKLGQSQFFWEEIENAKRMAPQESGIYYLAGLYWFQTKEAYDKAAEWFRSALERNSNHLLARCYLALCLQATQHYEEAESTLLEAVGHGPQTNSQAVMPLQILVSLELDMDRPSDALDYAKMAARLAPDSGKVQLGLGKAAWAAHDQTTAMTALKAAAELDPQSPEPHYLLSRVYSAQGEDRMAQQELAAFKELRQPDRGPDD